MILQLQVVDEVVGTYRTDKRLVSSKNPFKIQQNGENIQKDHRIDGNKSSLI
jgi:hypothetical protein